MGTNYFLRRPDCPCCGQSRPDMHIGKSSAGWCFTLHVIPEDRINTLEDWQSLFAIEGAYIVDEYGRGVSVADMLRCITARSRRDQPLQRHPIDGHHCVGHGPGTYDYCPGDFC